MGTGEIKRESMHVTAHTGSGCANTELLVISSWIGCQMASHLCGFATSFFFPWRCHDWKSSHLGTGVNISWPNKIWD